MIILQGKEGQLLSTDPKSFKVVKPNGITVRCMDTDIYNRPLRVVAEGLIPHIPMCWQQLRGDNKAPIILETNDHLTRAYNAIDDAHVFIDLAAGGGACAEDHAQGHPKAEVRAIDIAYNTELFPTIIETPNLTLQHGSWSSLPPTGDAKAIVSFMGAFFYENPNTVVPSVLGVAASGSVIAFNELKRPPTHSAAGVLFQQGCEVYTGQSRFHILQTVIAFKK